MRLSDFGVEARHAAKLNAHRVSLGLVLGHQLLQVLHLNGVIDLHLELPLGLSFFDLNLALLGEHSKNLEVVDQSVEVKVELLEDWLEGVDRQHSLADDLVVAVYGLDSNALVFGVVVDTGAFAVDAFSLRRHLLLKHQLLQPLLSIENTLNFELFDVLRYEV